MTKTRLPALLLATLAGPLWAATQAIEPAMVSIPGGRYTMGSAAEVTMGGQVLKDIGPAHTVAIKPFKLALYMVTRKEFSRFVAATHYAAPNICTQMHNKDWFDAVPASWDRNSSTDNDYQPVTCIGWDGAQAYVSWLARATGKPYRLPTEAEWEYAARGGTSATHYWGEDADHTQACRYANVADRAAEAAIKRDYDGLESRDHVGVAPCDDQSGYASVVGMYEPNHYGLYDMMGNTDQFLQDCYHPSYGDAPADGSAWLEADCKWRAVRGGSWHWPAYASVQRGAIGSDFVGALEGLRLALSVEGKIPAPAGAASVAFARDLAAAQRGERARRKR